MDCIKNPAEKLNTSPVWLPGGHMQTIWPTLMSARVLPQASAWVRSRWDTPDRDFIDIDWWSPEASTPHRPLLILFHGLEGSSRSPYAKAFAMEGVKRGWDVAVAHFRGCSGEMNLAPRAYHSGDTAEIDWILKRFAAMRKTQGQVVVVGISLGGNVLARWAGEQASAAAADVPGLRALASVSAPLDLAASGAVIDRGLNRLIYARYFLNTMKQKAFQKHQQYPGCFDLMRVMRATSLREFDDAFTAPLHGFKGVDHYWQQASAKPVLRNVRLPLLLLNARNDPLVPQASLPTADDVSSDVTLWQPAVGGHVGFVQNRGRWGLPGHAMAMPSAVCDWLSLSHTPAIESRKS